VKIDLGKIADADDVAEAIGVCRKTVVRRARESGAAVVIDGRVYVERTKLREVAGEKWNDAAESLSHPVRGKGTIDTVSVVSRGELASMLSLDATTVWRVTRRHGIGIDAYRGRKLYTKGMAGPVLAGVGKTAMTRDEVSAMRSRAANARWSRQRGEKSGKSGKAAAGSSARRSRVASR
jgi:hypothetical protein